MPGDQFIWPEFVDERSRIKAYTERFKDKTVIEAFQEIYGVSLIGENITGSNKANELPKEYKVGDVIRTRLKNVSKGSVEFDDINFKGTVGCNTNLYKYSKLRGGSEEYIDVIVIDSRPGHIVLDPLKNMTEEWIKRIIYNPASQYVLGNPRTIKVKNLQLTAGGFVGKAVVPTTSTFVGEDVTIDAFIPGSQIVLNITNDFNQFVGKDVEVFVLNYAPKGTNMSLICSRKAYLTFLGHERLIDLFKHWCEDSQEWKNKYSCNIYKGVVTGVINSSRKCGLFVEIPELNITGMVPTPADKLVGFKPGNNVDVNLNSFDEETYFNKDVMQVQHVPPYIIENGILVKCNLKPILKLV